LSKTRTNDHADAYIQCIHPACFITITLKLFRLLVDFVSLLYICPSYLCYFSTNENIGTVKFCCEKKRLAWVLFILTPYINPR